MSANPHFIAATGAVTTLPTGTKGRLMFVVLTAGADAASAIVYDGQAATRKLITVKAPAGTTVYAGPLEYPFINGLYCTVTGTAPEINLGIG